MALVGSGGIGYIPRGNPSTKLYGVNAASGMSGGPSNFKPVSGKAPTFGGTTTIPRIKPPAGAKPVKVAPPHITNTPGVNLGLITTPGTPATPPTPGTPPVTTTTEPSPYDSTYYIDLAAATQKANNQIATYQRDIANGGISTQNAIQQLQYNQGLSTRNAQNVENSRGGFAQGALGNTIGQIGKASLDAQSADTLRYQQDSQNWNAAITGVQQGLSTEMIALGLASAARQAGLGLTGTTSTTDGTPGTPGAPGTPPTVSSGGRVVNARLNTRPSANRNGPTPGRGFGLQPIRGGFSKGAGSDVKNPTGFKMTGLLPGSRPRVR